MSALRHLSKKFGKYFDRRILASIIILSSSVWVLTYAVSDEMIQTQIDYLIWVIDANVAVQNLDETEQRMSLSDSEKSIDELSMSSMREYEMEVEVDRRPIVPSILIL
jgi:hypothetical protein